MQHFQGEAHTHKTSYTCHQRFPTHFACHNVLISPVGGFPCIENIACESDIFPENSRRQKTKYDWIELFTPRYQHSGTVNDANQHALIFFSLLNAVAWIWVAKSCSDLWSKLLAGRETAGMSLENMYWVHLDSMDKEQLYREKRGCDPCKNTAAFHSISRDRQREKICHACRCSAPWSLWAGIQRSVFPTTSRCWLLDLFHLCHSHGHTNY